MAETSYTNGQIPHIEARLLDELRTLLGPKFCNVVQIYLQDTSDRLEALALIAHQPAAADRIVLEAHAIRASSAQIGALRMADAAKAMELAAERKPADPAGFVAFLDEMQDVYRETEKLLRPFCAVETAA